jgi:hypothetical protein
LINPQGEIDPPDSISTRATVAPVRCHLLFATLAQADALSRPELFPSAFKLNSRVPRRGFENRLPLRCCNSASTKYPNEARMKVPAVSWLIGAGTLG